VSELGRLVDLGLVENDGDFDFGGGDHLDVHAAIAEAFEKGGSHTRVGAHADSDHAELGDTAFFDDFAGADFSGNAVDDGANFFEFVGRHREGNIRGSANGDILNDHIDDDIRLGERGEDAGG